MMFRTDYWTYIKKKKNKYVILQGLSIQVLNCQNSACSWLGGI